MNKKLVVPNMEAVVDAYRRISDSRQHELQYARQAYSASARDKIPSLESANRRATRHYVRAIDLYSLDDREIKMWEADGFLGAFIKYGKIGACPSDPVYKKLIGMKEKAPNHGFLLDDINLLIDMMRKRKMSETVYNALAGGSYTPNGEITFKVVDSQMAKLFGFADRDVV